MKHHFTIFVFFSLLAALPASVHSSLLVARTYVHLDGTGIPYVGDSTTLSYNSQLLANQYKTWNLDASDNWVLSSRSINHSYDADGNLLYYLSQVGDDINGWTNSNRYNYSYDVDGHEISFLEEKWNGAAWVTSNSMIRVYDANGNELSSTGIDFRYLSTYDAQNRLQNQTYQELITGNWTDKSRIDYVYSPNTTISTAYDWTNNAWEEISRSTMTFDASGNSIENLYEQWNGSAWENGFLESLSYNANGYLLENLTKDWNGFTWENVFLTAYTYDAANNLTYWSSSNWGDSSWEGSIRQFNSFDDENNFIRAQTELWDGFSWYTFSYGNFYYADFLSTHSPMPADFQIFPNPVNSVLKLKSEGLRQAKIFDHQGQLLRSERLNGQAEETIRVGDLPVGNYFLQVVSRDGKIGIKPLQIMR